MPVTVTPLRYPGGKSQLKPLLVDILRANQLVNCTYVEPFAGGCGLAMALLLERKIYSLHINDIDAAIHAFWYCVLNRTEELLTRMWRTPVTLEEWHKQRAVQTNRRASMIALGFSTLFLNRTNRSGILKGGVIGGLSQNGNYLLDCRFNKEDLERKILAIAARRHAIVLTCLDALELVRTVASEYGQETLVNLDPPYYTRGPGLYTNFYAHDDHAILAETVQKLPVPWMVTYDDCAPIREMYRGSSIETMPLRYSAQEKRSASELLITPRQLSLPQRLSAA
jgi:DNA adenine methylase